MKLNMNDSFIDVNEDNHKVLFFHRRKCCTSIICKFCEDTACGDSPSNRYNYILCAWGNFSSLEEEL